MMRTNKFLVLSLVLELLAGAAVADGLIVPVHRDIRVRGHWAVEYHHVDIRVRDQVASVAIDQKFVNTSRGMIEVEYLFPVPPGAAIDSMTLLVDGKEFAAKLLDAKEARKIYEDIVRRKKDPALLEYAGFGLYRTRAFPLEPGKPVRVQVTYKQICKKQGDVVEVWYPLNTEKFSAKKINDVRVTVDIKADADISSVYSPTHDLDVKRKTPQHVIATYHAKNTIPTTDIQVFYKPANKDVGVTFLTYQPKAGEDGFFLMLLNPNPRTDKTKVVPKNVVIVMDRSGSMSGKKITQAKAAVEFILKRLNENDRFNVIAYSDLIEPFFEGLVRASKQKTDEASEALDRIDARGGTNIHEALKTAMGMCSTQMFSSESPARPTYVIFLTDGLPTVGVRDEKTILGDTSKANKIKARLFAFGVGYDVNVRLLDKLVRQNNGRSDYVKPNEPIEAKVSSLYAKIKNPVMTNLKVEIKDLRLSDMYPREIGDLFEGDQIVLVGRYDKKNASRLSLRSDLPYGGAANLVVTGTYQGKQRGFEYPVKVALPGRNARFAFIEKIWAMRRIGWLMDQVQLNGETKEIIDEIIRLSKRYGIMTPYTSFLADETTALHRPAEVRAKASDSMLRLRSEVAGAAGQRAAMMRQTMNKAAKAPASSGYDRKGSSMVGNAFAESYEAGDKEHVANVRNVGNQAVYRRGRTWVAANAAGIDPKKDAARIQIIRRFSEEYFQLVRDNNITENQVFSSQRDNEELLISLRGQAYLIK